MSFLDNEINIENIKSYAKVCREIAQTVNILDEEYNCIIVPSRGAAIFERYASYYKGVHPKNESISGIKHFLKPNAFRNTVYLPFTADTDESISDLSPHDIRRFWCKVTADLINGNKSLELMFYNFIRNSICRLQQNIHYENNLKSGKFIFLDTAISGQALCQIIQSFDELGITDCFYIAIIDENGEKLKPEYKRILEKLSTEGRAELLYVNRLFTEDRGPAVSGIWSVVFPELMTIGRNEIKEFYKTGIIGAGMYYHEIKQRKDGSNVDITVANSTLSTLLFCALHENHILNEATRSLIIRYKETLYNSKVFRSSSTLNISETKLKNEIENLSDINVSRSHVLRANFTDDDAYNIIKKFKEISL